MVTCSSSAAQSWLSGSAVSCSKQEDTVGAGSNAQHKSLVGRTRKSTRSTKVSTMSCPTWEIDVNPCFAINVVIIGSFPWTIPKVPALSDVSGKHLLALGHLKILAYWTEGQKSWDPFPVSSHLSLPVNVAFLLILMSSLTMPPKPTFNLTNIYILGTISPKIFLKCCCLACSQKNIYIWKAMTWWRKTSKRHILKFDLQNYSLTLWTHLPLSA